MSSPPQLRSGSGLRCERRGTVGIITLANPAKRHALDPALLAALRQGIFDLAAAGAAALVLHSDGPTFCAGYDVAALPDQPDDDWLRGHGLLAAVLELLCQGPLPTVAALPGAAWGAGCELALSCDLRVAHAGVTLAMPPVRLGIIYTPQGVARLLALCGAGRARRLLLTAEPIDAASAEQWGLIDRLVDESQVLPVAIELATQLGEKPPAALLGTRQLIEQLLRHGPQLSPAAEQELLQKRHQAWQSPEAQAARQRFRKPRPPG